jgi:hypothetical protein
MDNKLTKITDKSLSHTPLIITTGSAKNLCIYQVNEDNTINEKEIITEKYSCDSISITNDNKYVVGTFGTNVAPSHLLT